MGGKGKRKTGKTNQQQGQAEKPETTTESEASDHEDDTVEKMDEQGHSETLRVGLATINKNIKDLTEDTRHKLTTLKDELKKEMKEEITVQQEIERKLTDSINELQTQKATLAESQVHIAELEEWKTDAGEVIMEMLEQSLQMQEKVTDLIRHSQLS